MIQKPQVAYSIYCCLSVLKVLFLFYWGKKYILLEGFIIGEDSLVSMYVDEDA